MNDDSHLETLNVKDIIHDGVDNVHQNENVSVYDSNGNELKGERLREAIGMYLFYKKAVFVSEILFFAYFIVIACISLGNLIGDVEIPGGIPIDTKITVWYAAASSVIGYGLLIFYLFSCMKYSINGDDQIDHLLSNMYCLLFTVGITVSVYMYHIFMYSYDDTMVDVFSKRYMYIATISYGFIGSWIMYVGMCKHSTTSITAKILRQKDSAYSILDGLVLFDANEEHDKSHNAESTEDKNKTDVKSTKQHFMMPGNSKNWCVAMILMSTVNISVISMWLLYSNMRGHSLEVFTYKIVMFLLGLDFVLVAIMWAIWTKNTMMFRGDFTSNFDTFCTTHLLYVGSMCMLLVCYHQKYQYLPLDLFPTSPNAVDMLQRSFLSNINSFVMTSFPLVTLGLGSGCCLLLREWPVDVEEYTKWINEQKD
jgi:hypothetical protein